MKQTETELFVQLLAQDHNAQARKLKYDWHAQEGSMLLDYGKLNFCEAMSLTLIHLNLNRELIGTAYDLSHLVKQLEDLLEPYTHTQLPATEVKDA